MRSVRFFNTYFSKLPSLVLANILMLPFDLLAAGFGALMYKLFGGLNAALMAAGLIILNVGMAGTSLVCRYIYTGNEQPCVKAFFKGLRENAARCLLHGVVFYAVFAVSYLSMVLYYSGTKTSAVFWLLFILTGLVALGVLFASYYMNMMTVTMDIPLRDLYRNCILFSFGELKNNLLATFALLIFGSVIFTIMYIINNAVVILIVLGLLMVFIIPSTVQYIITFYTYDDMIAILDETKRTKPEEPEEKKPAPILGKSEAEDISKAAQNSKDEYIYYNGRMIKRSDVEKFLDE